MQRKTYEIITWSPRNGAIKATKWDTRYRRDYAGNVLYRHAYNALEANGLRDTKLAWRIVAEVERVAALPFVDGRMVSINIGNTHYTVQYNTHYTS